MKTERSQTLYAKAKKMIPGGTQLLSKRPEMFLPDQWPAYYAKAKGTEVWDIDGNKYVDMGYNGIGSCILGAADEDVDSAVRAAVDNGSMSTLNAPEEVELAELMIGLHPWASKVRYARCGGEAMAVAVRIARAATGRDKIAFCGYHGWHDWYLASNLASEKALDGHLLPGLKPNGVPRALAGTSLPFHYNKIEDLKEIVSTCGSQLAAIVLEPIRSDEPNNSFLQEVRAIAKEVGAVLIFDEITIGFRLNVGGAHMKYGVTPDIAVFAKGISNGYPMAVILGNDSVMRAAEDTFISSTYWTDRIGPTAAIATVKKMQKCDVPTHLNAVGKRVKDGWAAAAKSAGIHIHVSGVDPLGHFGFEGDDPVKYKTAFIQLMLERGYLAPLAFYATYAHTNEIVDKYLGTVEEVFNILKKAKNESSIDSLLKGPLAHTGFYRLTR